MNEAEVMLLKTMNDRFDRLEARVEARGNGIESQVAKINGRVTDAHVLLAEHGILIDANGDGLKKAADAIHKLSGIVQKKLTPRDVSLVVMAIVTTVAILQFFGMIVLRVPAP